MPHLPAISGPLLLLSSIPFPCGTHDSHPCSDGRGEGSLSALPQLAAPACGSYCDSTWHPPSMAPRDHIPPVTVFSLPLPLVPKRPEAPSITLTSARTCSGSDECGGLFAEGVGAGNAAFSAHVPWRKITGSSWPRALSST